MGNKTNVHPNSVDSYHELDLTAKQLQVIDVLIALGSATDKQIADYLGYTVNRITGRITELRNKGVVVECDTIIGEFGKLVRVSKLRSPSPSSPHLPFKETLF